MKDLGLIREMSKGHWEPTQELQFLGLVINTKLGLVKIPEEKVQALKESLPDLIQKSKLSAKKLASIAGKIVCLALAFTPARLYTRELYQLVDAAHRRKWEWNYLVPLSKQVKLDAAWLLRNLDIYNGRSAWKPSLIEVVTTDASLTGWGAHWRDKTAGGNWSVEWEQKGFNQQIARKELMAIYLALKTFAKDLQGKSIVLRVDNQNVVSYMENGGGKKQDMIEIVRKIWDLTVIWDISIYKTEWIPTEENVIADQESRMLDHNDWEVTWDIFQEINHVWGPFTVDRFASSLNKKVQRFNSWRMCPGTEAVDAFTQDWNGEFNWMVPPLNLIHRVINHIQETHAQGVLIVPNWPSQPWWPQLQSIKVDVMILNPIKAFQPGPSGQVEPWNNQKWNFLAVLVSG
jgi:hypothetical protein